MGKPELLDPAAQDTGPSQKNIYVRQMFNGISGRYDFLNHFLSAGIDRSWRRHAIKMSQLGEGHSFLDIACGTGDLSLEAMRKNPVRVVGVDFAENMLRGFVVKRDNLRLDGKIEIVQASAEELPFPEDTFDVAGVAFGARNFGDLRQGLSEMRRVLKKNGRIVVLEFSRPRMFPIKQFYFFYFRKILPLVGRLISGDRGAYTYLPDSVSAFPDGSDFLDVMRSVDFREVKSTPFTFGIATAYLGIK
jgi:demethylmenaquinone methyltransferase / 2-methoxy-6-polyprenyl-1,4-benzoquinol methylase